MQGPGSWCWEAAAGPQAGAVHLGTVLLQSSQGHGPLPSLCFSPPAHKSTGTTQHLAFSIPQRLSLNPWNLSTISAKMHTHHLLQLWPWGLPTCALLGPWT